MKPQNEANRTVIIGSLKEEKPNMKVVECKNSKGDDLTVYVPNACVADTIDSDGQTVFLLQHADVNGVSIGVKSSYSYTTNGDAALQSIADMWVEFGETNQPTDELPTLSVDDEEPLPSISIDEDLPSISIADDEDLPSIDDETPNFNESIGIELADALLGEEETVEDAEEKQAKQKLTAAQKAAKLRKERFEASEQLKNKLSTDVSKALADGKRHEDFGAWNFTTETYDTVIRKTDPITGNHSYHEITDGKGDARVRVLVNPTIVDEENPLGVVLNRAIGPNFEPVQHPAVFLPVIETIRGINMANGCTYELKDGDKQATLVSGNELITWDAFSFNKGARAMLNLDLTGWGAKTRNESAKGLNNFGYVNLSANKISDMLVEEQGGHRIGVSIINAHDGKQALQSFMSVLRTYCGNLAMRGGVQELLMDGDKSKIRHMKGAVASFDPELFADRLGGALEESYKHLIAMNILRHLPIEANLFD